MAKPRVKESPKGAASKPAPAKTGSAKTGAAKTTVAKPRTAEPRTQKLTSFESAGAKLNPIAPGFPDDRLERLWAAIQQVRRGERVSPRTARLLAAGPPKMAQKVVEEAAEVAIEAVTGKREALINESVDLLYNLVALWNGLGVEPTVIWAEMDRREKALGMAEKLPKTEDI